MSQPPPPHSARRRISASELAEAVHASDEAAFLVEPRVLRRVIKADRDVTGLGLQVPHWKSYVVGREKLLEIVAADELHPHASVPPRVILLPLPESEKLAEQSADDLLVRYWRLLFHARVHYALEEQQSAGQLTPADVRDRIHRIGQTPFDEIRAVLRAEDLLLPPRDDASVFIEFAAVFLELSYFAPKLLPRYFPAIAAPKAVAKILAEDLDAAALFEQTRPKNAPLPPGAPEPASVKPSNSEPDKSPKRPAESKQSSRRSRAANARNGQPDRASRQRRIDVSTHSHRGQANARYAALERQAEQAEQSGNLVRAAILRIKAAGATKGKAASSNVAAGHEDIKQLAWRLQDALGFAPGQRAAWEDGLKALLKLSSDDRLTTEGRLLYDLQKVCDDHEREIYTVDLGEWALSWGRRPIRRMLPHQREVLICKHLHSARRRLIAARLPDGVRERFGKLLHDAIHHAEDEARTKIRPHIARALHEAGLRPANLPEEVGRNKVVEQLLDKVVESGYLRFGDLRDAISRNRLKLPDLPAGATPGEWSAAGAAKRLFVGDHLLQADRELSRRLDGVYHRGEVYLRLFQRIASVGFGTAVGRALNRYLILPLLAAFTLIVFFQELAHLTRLDRLFAGAHAAGGATEEASQASMPIMSALGQLFRGNVFSGATWGGVLGEFPISMTLLVVLSAFFLGVINSAAFRQSIARGWKQFSMLVREAVNQFIGWLARPVMQAILRNPLFVFARRHVFKPLLFTVFCWAILRVLDPTGETQSLITTFVGGPLLFLAFVWVMVRVWRAEVGIPLFGLAAVAGFALYVLGFWGMLRILDARVGNLAFFVLFAAFEVLLNTRWGRDVEEIGNEWLVRSWKHFRTRVLAGIFWLIVDVSKACLEAVDRALYAADEWLRFRKGETILSFTGKAIVGAVWSVVTYVVRFAVNLLIEPQINPIKHFPVVTVSHKVVWSLAIAITPAVANATGWDVAYTATLLSTIAWAIPGIFGFLAWELKENWKLYHANRPATLRPVIIGHHAETMLRFMRPGIHSGTLPKLFRKIRRAPTAGAAQKHFEQLEHVRHTVANYIGRELLYLLKQSPAWQRDVTLRQIQLGSNRVRVELRCEDLSEKSCWLIFKEQSRWLVVSVDRPGWIGQLTQREQRLFRNAILGLYKTAGAHLVHEHVQNLFPKPGMPFDVSDEGLVVWPGGDYKTEVVYDLDAEGAIPPRLAQGESAAGLPPLERDELLFSRRDIAWDDWVAAWSPPAAERHVPMLLEQVRVFPEIDKNRDPASSDSQLATVGERP